MVQQFTLYTSKRSPFAHRVELALAEAKADFKTYEIDVKNKPEWYAPKVNPASKVPAVAYGGPDVSPDTPSPQSHKISESLVLLEFVADLYPDASLLPKDPVQRAKARFFIDTVTTKFVPEFLKAISSGQLHGAVLSGLVEGLQDILPPEGYAVGSEWSIADAAVTPFAARMNVLLKCDIGPWKEGEGKKAYDTLQNDPKYARFKKYYEDVTSRPSFKATFDEEYAKEVLTARYAEARAQTNAA